MSEKVTLAKGRGKEVSNGIADWVYEEEVLSESKAYYWSPEGNFLAFLRFDDTNVTEIVIPKFNYEISFPGPEDLGLRIKYPR